MYGFFPDGRKKQKWFLKIWAGEQHSESENNRIELAWRAFSPALSFVFSSFFPFLFLFPLSFLFTSFLIIST